MKRSEFKRKTPWRPERKALARAVLGASPMPLSSLKRSWIRRRPTRVKAGSNPKRLAWIRTLPCCVPGCAMPAPSEASHERKKGTGLALKEPDNRAWPSCRQHHRDYEKHDGFFDMPDDDRKAWTDATCDMLDEGYARTFGEDAHLREPIALREAV